MDANKNNLKAEVGLSLQSLAQEVEKMQASISDMSINIALHEKILQLNKTPVNQYISLWKDMDGHNLTFSPEGSTHPIVFLKKLKRLFEEAGVPESARISIAIGCLRDSAAVWGGYKEDTFDNFEQFEKEFTERYWGMEEQRDLFHEIKYGRCEYGSRADYILRLAYDSKFLTEQLTEQELVECLINHFSEDRHAQGISSSGLKTVEELEISLKKVDNTHSWINKSSNNDNNFNRKYRYRRYPRKM